MPKYPAVLDLPPASAVALIGDTLLDTARKAWSRLDDPGDTEALHDFRVALRRLRSVLRAFRPHLGPAVTRKLRRRLRDLARATNPARDSEVRHAWCKARWDRLTRRERTGARWYLGQLEEDLDRAYEESRRVIAAEFSRVEGRLRKRLGTAPGDIAAGGMRRSFGGVAADLVREHAAALRDHLSAIQAPGDEAEIHLARIAAKRLRYLLELLEGELDPARRAVQRLKGLQTMLGDLRDAQVMALDLAETCETAAAEHAKRVLEVEVSGETEEKDRRAARRRNAVPGIVALARLAREARDDLFEAYRSEWHEDARGPLERELEAVVEACQRRAALPVEIERKYLLAELPQRAGGAPSAEIEQGWLPGERLVERLRYRKTPAGDEFFRTVKVGAGVTRVELEDPASPEVFASLWPLTEGRRVRKRRYTIEDEGLCWEIDEFLDRNLVLAEVELPHARLRPQLPAWLEPVVVREVTGDPAYVNANLAC